MWVELIRSLASGTSFVEPATWSSVDLAKSKLGISFPSELETLYLETDGVFDKYKCSIIWPVERVVSDNLHFRSEGSFQDLYMPFDNLLFFGDSGCGDQ